MQISKIQACSNPNFTAKFISDKVIRKRDVDGNYNHQKVALVELDKNSFEDLHTLKNLDKNWGVTFLTDIRRHFNSAVYYKTRQDENFYALTTQKNKFDELEPEKVLGVVNTKDVSKYTTRVLYLQVDPKINYSAKNRPYKHVGQRLLETIREFNPNKMIQAFATPQAIGFYENCDMEKGDVQGEFVWDI